VSRSDQDRAALDSHRRAVAAWDRGFFDDLVIPIGEVGRDTIPRREHLPGAAVASSAGLRSPQRTRLAHRRKLVASDGRRRFDLGRLRGGSREVAAGRLQGQADRLGDRLHRFPEGGTAHGAGVRDSRLLARNGLSYADIDLWEIHEAFAAQVLAHIEALENPAFLRLKAGVEPTFGAFPANA